MKNSIVDKLGGLTGLFASAIGILVVLTALARGVVTDDQLDSTKKEVIGYVDIRHAEVQKSVDEIKVDVKDTRKMIFELWSDNRKNRR